MTEAAEDWRGLAVHGPDGEWIGQVSDVYDDEADSDGVPAVVAVRTGLLGLRSSLVPVRGTARRVGDRIEVPYDREQVTSAPDVAETEELAESDVAAVLRHYGLAEAGGTARRVVRRRVEVTVVESARDVEALARVLPPEVPPEEVRAAAESDEPVVIVVRERETVLPEDPPAAQT